MFIDREFIRKNKNYLFVFGDNDHRKGIGGMAREFRGEPNTLGIRTKKAPYMSQGAFYTDNEYETNCSKITEDIEKLKTKIIKYDKIYIPSLLGCGLARLPELAPKTFEYLELAINNLKKIHKDKIFIFGLTK